MEKRLINKEKKNTYGLWKTWINKAKLCVSNAPKSIYSNLILFGIPRTHNVKVNANEIFIIIRNPISIAHTVSIILGSFGDIQSCFCILDEENNAFGNGSISIPHGFRQRRHLGRGEQRGSVLFPPRILINYKSKEELCKTMF